MGSVTNGWRKQSGFGWFVYWHPEKKIGFLLDNWLIVVYTFVEVFNDKEAKEFELYFYDRNVKGMKKMFKNIRR